MTENPIERIAGDFGYWLGYNFWAIWLLVMLVVLAVLAWWLVRRRRRGMF